MNNLVYRPLRLSEKNWYARIAADISLLLLTDHNFLLHTDIPKTKKWPSTSRSGPRPASSIRQLPIPVERIQNRGIMLMTKRRQDAEKHTRKDTDKRKDIRSN